MSGDQRQEDHAERAICLATGNASPIAIAPRAMGCDNPITYLSEGRQFIAIAAGHSLMTCALPE
ncbi:MAG: hypothetical protein O3A25_00895 [Acidobacteria bacterium]|nr:hypothetical protein [Acidobacteriota bacterium]